MSKQKAEDKIFSEIIQYHNIPKDLVSNYLNPNEILIGFGRGGSEALVIFVKIRRTETVIVRKIWNHKMVVAKWSPAGLNAMTPPLRKAFLQIAYLQNLPPSTKSYFPNIIRVKSQGKNTQVTSSLNQKLMLQEVICDQNYISGIEVSTFIERYSPPSEIVAHLYIEIYRCLKENIHNNKITLRIKPTIETSYLSKITDRLELAEKTSPKVFGKLLAGKYLNINGVTYMNIPILLKKLRNLQNLRILEPKYHSFVMGDTNTENIKITNINPIIKSIKKPSIPFTYKDIGIKFIDPRAIGFDTTGENTIDDYMYDNKPLHNSLGNYDVIHSDRFSLKVNSDNEILKISLASQRNNPFNKPYRGIGKNFKDIMERGWGVHTNSYLKDDPYWIIRFVFIMGTHFAAMPPFHFKKELDGSVQDELLVQKRAVAIYCEGVKWLNLSYLMMNGKVPSLFGINVPKSGDLTKAVDSKLNYKKIISGLQYTV